MSRIAAEKHTAGTGVLWSSLVYSRVRCSRALQSTPEHSRAFRSTPEQPEHSGVLWRWGSSSGPPVLWIHSRALQSRWGFY